MQEAKRPLLDQVLAYQNSDAVYRFIKTYGITTEESEDIFIQVKKWLWLAHERKLENIPNGLSIDHPIVVIDEMWHNFVLFTKEYFQFCEHYFGYYIHHAPATKQEEDEYRAGLDNLTPQEKVQKKMDGKRWQYEYIYDKLGKETFQKWYFEYPRKYSYRQLAELHFNTTDDMALIEPPKELPAGVTLPTQAERKEIIAA